MKVLLSWLKDFVDFDLSAAEIASGLTLQGTEAETVQLFSEFLGEEASVARILGAARFSSETTAVFDVEIGGEKFEAASGARYIPSGFSVVAVKTGGGYEIPTAAEFGLKQQNFPIIVPAGMSLDDVKADAVIEFETLSNRGDLLSHIGIAREVAVLTGNSLKEPEVFDAYGETEEKIARPIELAAPELCPRYIGMSFSEVNIADSPDWMWYRLVSIGLNPISNVVDITNYVLMELGQPLHAFDPAKLDGGIIVRRAADGEKFAAINHNEYELNAGNLVIADQSKAVAIGGIMGGLDSEISDSTSGLFLESAYFTPVNIRKSTKKLALMSDSSLRFGRGVDTDGALRGALRFAKLLLDSGGARFVSGSFRDADLRDKTRLSIEFPVSIVESFLGINIPEAEIIAQLRAAGFDVEGGPPVIKVTPPSWRGDFEIAEDVSEEILRLYSYTKVAPDMPQVKMGQGRLEKTFEFESRVRDVLVSMTLQEVRTYSLISPGAIAKWMGRKFEGDSRDYSELIPEAALLGNPDTADMSALRSTLGLGLVEVLTANRKKHMDKLPVIFEVGRGFGCGEPEGAYAYKIDKNGRTNFESRRLGILAAADSIPPPFAGPDFAKLSPLFSVKAILEKLFGELCVHTGFVPASQTASAWARADAALEVTSENGTLGFAALLNTALDPFEGERGEIAYAEINLDELAGIRSGLKSIESPSQYPAVARDIALVLPLSAPAGGVMGVFKQNGGESLKEVTVFDQYAGKNLKPVAMAGRVVPVKNLAFSLKFQRGDRTLTGAEVDEVILSVLKGAFNEFGAVLRDYEQVKSDSVFSSPALWNELVALYGRKD